MPPKVEKKKDNQRSESRSNLVGRFTTSVKKFVQEVESDGTREGAVQTNERLRNTTHKVSESYTMVRCSLLNLHKRYEESKSERNVFHKYNLYRSIIKDVIVLEVQYWILLDIPKQEKQEQVATYVLRACSALEKASETRAGGDSTSSKGGGGGGGQTALKGLDEEQREKERARVDAMAVKEIEEENNQLVNELYRFLKKYMTLRNIIYELKVSYMDAKVYPIIPRYTMLKEMIKDVVRHPNYMEVCHEDANLNIPET